MSMRNAIANLAVKDLKASQPWYEKLLGRGPDRADPAAMVEWVFEQGGRLQLYQQPARAGGGAVTLAVGNLDTELQHLNKAGITAGEVMRTPAERIISIEDPDGNAIALTEMSQAAPHESVPSTVPGPTLQVTHPLERVPENIASDPKLSPADVRKTLDCLIADLEALLRASEESMTGSDPGQVAQLLQRAHIVRDRVAAPPAAS